MQAGAALAKRLEEVGLRAGLDAVGIAKAEVFDDTHRHIVERKAAGLHGGMHFTYGNPLRSTDPSRALPGARSLVVGALSYIREESPEAQDHADPVPAGGRSSTLRRPPRAGRVARYAREDHYKTLRLGLRKVADELCEAGFSSRVLVDDNALVDRTAAQRAGLGFFGRNTLLLLTGRGSWFVLGSVVTDAALDPSGPALDHASGCGSCHRCQVTCPTGALRSDGVLDARRCLAWLLEAPGRFPPEHRAALGGRIYGCDECQNACPLNSRAVRKRPPPPPGSSSEAEVDLLELLASDDEELLRHFGRWYIPGRQARYLRRNALVALGNIASGRDREVEQALENALAHPDPIVRGHAVWAAARLGHLDLLETLCEDECDPDVLEELRLAAPGCPT